MLKFKFAYPSHQKNTFYIHTKRKQFYFPKNSKFNYFVMNVFMERNYLFIAMKEKCEKWYLPVPFDNKQVFSIYFLFI